MPGSGVASYSKKAWKVHPPLRVVLKTFRFARGGGPGRRPEVSQSERRRQGEQGLRQRPALEVERLAALRPLLTAAPPGEGHGRRVGGMVEVRGGVRDDEAGEDPGEQPGGDDQEQGRADGQRRHERPARPDVLASYQKRVI